MGLAMFVYTLCPQMGKPGVLEKGSHGLGVVREDGAGCGPLPRSGSVVTVGVSDTELVTPAGTCPVCESGRLWNRNTVCDSLTVF